MAAEPKPYLTVERYLELDAISEFRCEYENGRLYVIEAASQNHAQIAMNLSAHLFIGLQRTECRVFSQGRKVQAAEKITLPDLVVVCGKQQTSFKDEVLLNPILLGEVLSPSTGDYDRGGKFERYRSIPSFREYLIVYQDKILVQQHIKQRNEDWLMRSHSDPLASIPLDSLPGLEIPLAAIYENVTWHSD